MQITHANIILDHGWHKDDEKFGRPVIWCQEMTSSSISDHTVFLVQFGLNLRLRVFQRAEISAFCKNSPVQIELETVGLPIVIERKQNLFSPSPLINCHLNSRVLPTPGWAA